MLVLETKRLIIRDHLSSDLNGVYALLSDLETMRFIPELIVTSIEEAKENLDMCIEESRKARRRKYFLSIIDKETNKYVGQVGFGILKIENNEKLIDLVSFIRKEYWRQGIGEESSKKLMEYAFQELNVIKIKMGFIQGNIASEQLMKKIGLQKEADLRNEIFHEGEWKNRVIYGILRGEWIKRQQTIVSTE